MWKSQTDGDPQDKCVDCSESQAVGDPLDAASRLTTVTSVYLLALNKDRVSLCIPGWSGTPYVDQDDLLMETSLALPPHGWEQRYAQSFLTCFEYIRSTMSSAKQWLSEERLVDMYSSMGGLVVFKVDHKEGWPGITGFSLYVKLCFLSFCFLGYRVFLGRIMPSGPK